jgi:hypothetical protein
MLCTGPTRAAKAGQKKSLVPARKAQRTNQERTQFMYSLSTHSPQFQQSAGPMHPSLVSLNVTFSLS